MYNEEVKRKYLESITSYANRADIKNFFQQAANLYEVENQTDVAYLTGEEYLSLFNSLNLTSLQAAWRMKGMIATYCMWYKENIDPTLVLGINNLDADQIKVGKSLPFKYIKDDQELLSMINATYGIADGYLAPPVAVLAWCGIKIQEALELKPGDISYEEKEIFLPDGTYVTIPDSLIDVLHVYQNTRQATRYNNALIDVYAYDHGLFLKKMLVRNSARSTTITKMNISVSMSEWSEQLQRVRIDKQLTYTSIQQSAVMHELYRLEQEGFDFSTPGGTRKIDEVNHFYRTSGKSITVKSILKTFQLYKEAFYSKN